MKRGCVCMWEREIERERSAYYSDIPFRFGSVWIWVNRRLKNNHGGELKLLPRPHQCFRGCRTRFSLPPHTSTACNWSRRAYRTAGTQNTAPPAPKAQHAAPCKPLIRNLSNVRLVLTLVHVLFMATVVHQFFLSHFFSRIVYPSHIHNLCMS